MVIKWCGKVEVFGIGADVFCTLYANDTVPHELVSGEVSCVRCEFIWVVNEVAYGRDADSVWIFFCCL